jgi:hypothetical protein
VDGRGAAFRVGAVKPLFEPRIREVGFAGSTDNSYDVSPDGQRFLILATDDTPTELPITLLVNWAAALRP